MAKTKKRAKRSPPLSKWTFVPRHSKEKVPYLYWRQPRGEYQAAVADDFNYHPQDVVQVRWVGMDGNVDYFAPGIDAKEVPASVALHLAGKKQPGFFPLMWGTVTGKSPYVDVVPNPSARTHLSYAKQLIKEARARKVDALRATDPDQAFSLLLGAFGDARSAFDQASQATGTARTARKKGLSVKEGKKVIKEAAAVTVEMAESLNALFKGGIPAISEVPALMPAAAANPRRRGTRRKKNPSTRRLVSAALK